MSRQSLKCLTQCWDTKGKRGKYFMNYSLIFRGFHGLRAKQWPHTSKPEWQRFHDDLWSKGNIFHPLVWHTFIYITHTRAPTLFSCSQVKIKFPLKRPDRGCVLSGFVYHLQNTLYAQWPEFHSGVGVFFPSSVGSDWVHLFWKFTWPIFFLKNKNIKRSTKIIY